MDDTLPRLKKQKTASSAVTVPLIVGQPSLVELHPNALTIDWDKTDILNKALSNGANIVDIRFMATHGALPKSRPVLLYQELCHKVLHHKHIRETRFTRAGHLIISSSHAQCLHELIAISSLLNVSVSTTILTSNITTRYLVRDVDVESSLIDIGTECLRNEMSIARIVRFTRMINGKREPSPTLLIEEYGKVHRSHVYLWYNRCRTDSFVDRPRQCLKCARFGHGDKFCHSSQRCFRCGAAHDTSSCVSATPVCPLCAGPHLASDRTCRFFQTEVKILEFAASHQVSVSEARRQVLLLPSSYAQKVTPAVSSDPVPDPLLPKILSLLTQLIQKLDVLLPVPVSSGSQLPSVSPALPLSRLDSSVSPSLDGLASSHSVGLADPVLPPPEGLVSSAQSFLPTPCAPLLVSDDGAPDLMEDSPSLSTSFSESAAERLKNRHRQSFKFACCYCSTREASVAQLTLHYDSHLVDHSLKCPHCTREFQKSVPFIKHLQSHSNISLPGT